MVRTKSTRKVGRKTNREVRQEQDEREKEKDTHGEINNPSYKIPKK